MFDAEGREGEMRQRERIATGVKMVTVGVLGSGHNLRKNEDRLKILPSLPLMMYR